MDNRNLAELSDSAIGRKDYVYANGRAYVTVHNIGLAATGLFSVRLLDAQGGQIGQAQWIELPGFSGKDPVTQTVSWDVADAASVARVEVDTLGELREVTQFNNILTL